MVLICPSALPALRIRKTMLLVSPTRAFGTGITWLGNTPVAAESRTTSYVNSGPVEDPESANATV